MPNIKDIIAQRKALKDPSPTSLAKAYTSELVKITDTTITEAKIEVEKKVDEYKEKAITEVENVFDKKTKELEFGVAEYLPQLMSATNNAVQDGVQIIKGEMADTVEKVGKIADGVVSKIEKARGPKGEPGENGNPGLPGKDGSPDTPNQVVDKVNIAEKKVNISSIKGLFEELSNIRQAITRSGAKKGGGGGGYWDRISGVLRPSNSTDATVVNAHEATGLVPQVMNGGYCAIGDLPDVATVPEGTFFFILP